jgi:hypothetical protein
VFLGPYWKGDWEVFGATVEATMADAILTSFLRHETQRALALAAASDRLVFTPMAGECPQRFVAEFRCQGLVKGRDGAVREADRWVVGIAIPDDYLRGPTVDPFRVLSWLGPAEVFHPNIRGAGVICVGRLEPGMDFEYLLHQLYEIITWQRYNLADCLNAEAAQWARNNLQRLPVDRRPLRRVALEMEVEPLGKAAEAPGKTAGKGAA